MKCWTTKNDIKIIRLLTGRCNVFAVLHNGKFILVDTGRKNRRRLLLKALDKLVNGGNTFTALVMTHVHFDHAENAAALVSRYHVPVFVDSNELEYLTQGRNPPIRGVMGLTKLINRIHWQLADRLFRYDAVAGATALDHHENGGVLSMEGVKRLPTSGHTPGSVSIIVDDEIALVGDTMHGVFPGNAWPPFAWDEKALLESWCGLMRTGCTRFLPAHGGARSRQAVSRQYDELSSRLA